MRTRSLFHKLIPTTIGLIALALISCTAAPPVEAAVAAASVTPAITNVTPTTTSTTPTTTGVTPTAAPATQRETPGALTSTELSAAEIDGLLFMREEEKLARDVYLALYERWGLRILTNIAASEATHMDAVLTLLDHYGLPDPAAGLESGEFANPDLQALYDQLVEQGSRSLADALRVGAAIEEIDILDLETHIAQTDKADIRRVYENLTKGSRNHLRSFTSTLQRQAGEVYQPQYLSQEAYQQIVQAAAERGQGS
jgi:hypothetical protein